MDLIVDLKIDENRCKQTLSSLPLILGEQVASVYSYIAPIKITDYCMYTWQ